MPYDTKVKNVHKIPRYCRNEDIENIFIETDSEEEEEEEEKDSKRILRADLDKWDRGARSWLSSGTLFLLLILFHVIQVRSDLRRFRSTAEIQIEEACSILDDKTASLQSALSLAAKDVGPVTLKFVRDLKTKVRAALYFAGQIFGGRIREFFRALLSYKYCIFVGILVALKSLTQAIWAAMSGFVGENNFISSLLNVLGPIASNVVSLLTNPDKYFGDLLRDLLDYIIDELMAIEIPNVISDSADICRNLKNLDFEDINRLIQAYIMKIIIALVVVLVLYNTFQFIAVVESKSEEVGLKELANKTNKVIENEFDSESESEVESEIESESESESSFIGNICSWTIKFFSYEPFWMFLIMGIFGIFHVKFSRSLHEKAVEIKKTVLDPQIDLLSQQFAKDLVTFLATLEESWRKVFHDLLHPINEFIKSLTVLFKPAIDFITGIGTTVVTFINWILEFLNFITPLKAGLKAALDCLFMSKLNTFLNIASLISDKILKKDWKGHNGGIVHLLRHSIKSVFRKIKITKFLKKLISINFLIFIRLVKNRSIFLYVYLIVCLILISQGFIMMTIKFILGYY